eukprot:g3414.t1
MSGSEPRATKLTVLSTVSSAPKITIKGRWKSKPPKDGPGPGAYTPGANAKFSGTTSVSIQGRHFQRQLRNTATPERACRGAARKGAYNGLYKLLLVVVEDKMLKPKIETKLLSSLSWSKYAKAVSFESTAPKYSIKSRGGDKLRSVSLTPGPGTSVGLVSSFG